MKLLRVGKKGKEKPAVLDKNNKIRDLSSHIKDFNSENLKFETISKIKNINIEELPELKNNERIGACIDKPGKFVAIGLNYSDHAKETGSKIPTEPIVFMKATSSISGPNDDIEMPRNSSKLDWEVELAFVVGKEAKNISEKEAPDHILGYCIVNDVSEREWQIEKLGQWVKGKSANTFGPTGPYLVTQDEIPDVNEILKFKKQGLPFELITLLQQTYYYNFDHKLKAHSGYDISSNRKYHRTVACKVFTFEAFKKIKYKNKI